MCLYECLGCVRSLDECLGCGESEVDGIGMDNFVYIVWKVCIFTLGISSRLPAKA